MAAEGGEDDMHVDACLSVALCNMLDRVWVKHKPEAHAQRCKEGRQAPGMHIWPVQTSAVVSLPIEYAVCCCESLACQRQLHVTQGCEVIS